MPNSKPPNRKAVRTLTPRASRLTRTRPTQSSHPLYPLCDGEPWSQKPRVDPQKNIKRKFLEAYFNINIAYSRLLAFRRKGRSQVRSAIERSLLQQIETALVHRESLDDHYASRGIIATPVYREGFTTDVRFNDRARKVGYLLVASSSSLQITIPLPAVVRAKLCKS